MRLLINGRPARGPVGYIVATLAVLAALAFLLFVVLPILGLVIAIAVGAGIVVLGMRAFGLLGGRRTRPDSDETDYRIESSRPHSSSSDRIELP